MRRLAWLTVSIALLAGACAEQPVSALGTAAPPASAPQSSPSTIPPAELNPLSISSIQRLDAMNGFIASWAGTAGPRLARTSDGGATWHSIGVPLATVTTIRFIDARTGWVAGVAGNATSAVLLHTADGGQTWEQALNVVAGQGGYPPLAIEAIDGLVAWALVRTCDGCVADLGRTIDGGRDWTWLTSGPITAIRFVTATSGWIAVDDGYPNSDIRVTGDGGRTWTTRARFGSGAVVGLDAAGASTAWALIRDGAYCTASSCMKYDLQRTTDGGSTWRGLGNPKVRDDGCAGGHIYGPLFASASRGWLVENSGAGGVKTSTGLLQSEDGGRTWRCHDAPVQTGAVSVADPLHVWVATGFGGGAAAGLYASDDGGATWRPIALNV